MSSDEPARTARVESESVDGEPVFHVVGLPERLSGLGPAARDLIDRAFAVAGEHGAAEVDLDELAAAREADGR